MEFPVQENHLLINCGLANKFNDSDWLPVNVRRGQNINQEPFRKPVEECPLEKYIRGQFKRYNPLKNYPVSVYLIISNPFF
jgi:hypothetical protein